jgi:glycosyltransferase involved in cell wall biosynthesis
MHVAILYAGSISRDMGGTSERVLQIAKRLADQGAQVTFSAAIEHHLKAPNLANLRVIAMPNRIIGCLSVCVWIAKLVAGGLTHRYDIVQIESFSSSRSLLLLLLLHPFSRKFVIVFHDKYFRYDPRKNFVGRLHIVFQRILLALFDASITPGLSVKKWFEELHGILVNKMVVIPNGAPNFTIKKDVDYSHLREKYKIDSNAFVALFFGAIGFEPNYDAAMHLYNMSDALSQKFKKNTGRKLVFIVAGTDSETLPKREYYVPLGFVNDLEELFSLTDVIVFPHLSSYTGPHLKTIYAFLSKKPVIASEDAVKDMPYVTPRVEFLPFDINESDTLLEALTELHCNKELGKRLALNAYHYSKKFSWKYISSIHLKLYKKLTS